MIVLTSLPTCVFSNHILPRLSLEDHASLAMTSNGLYNIVTKDKCWRVSLELRFPETYKKKYNYSCIPDSCFYNIFHFEARKVQTKVVIKRIDQNNGITVIVLKVTMIVSSITSIISIGSLIAFFKP